MLVVTHPRVDTRERSSMTLTVSLAIGIAINFAIVLIDLEILKDKLDKLDKLEEKLDNIEKILKRTEDWLLAPRWRDVPLGGAFFIFYASCQSLLLHSHSFLCFLGVLNHLMVLLLKSVERFLLIFSGFDDIIFFASF